MIITCTFLGGIIATIVTFVFMTPKYSSTVDLLVNQKTNDAAAQFNVQQADLQAIRTYKDVLTKGVILNDVLKEAKKKDNYKGNIEQLKNDISISNENNSQVISVTVENTNPYVAADIANMVGDVFTEKIKKIMQVNNVTIVNKATPVLKPVSPRKKLNLALGALIGLMVGVMIALLKELGNTKIDSEEFLTDELGLTVLGKVYHLDSRSKKYRIANVALIGENLDTNLKRKRV
ncbi:chain length regulator [Ligilactobacillus animalis KCTC 3501 = DSM 20602]|nr:chain length regulator [Ligilactobacillus animalis KCTC 3501 = DSM 20602]